MDSTILKTLSGTQSAKLNNESDLSSKYPTNYTATFSGFKSVFCLFPGKVLFLGYYKGTGSVNIAVSNHEIIRYLNLCDMKVANGQEVSTNDLVGIVDPTKDFQLEYCTQWKGDSKCPVRIGENLYYKQNPINILKGEYVPEAETTIANGIVRVNDTVKFSKDQSKEWIWQISDVDDVPASAIAMLSGNGEED